MKIPNQIVEKIYGHWKQVGESERKRLYLGGSIVGHHCDAYLWYYFRGCISEDNEGRLYRLFNRGQREETVFINDLRNIGCQVWDVDKTSGKQFEVKALGGHLAGHLDGVAAGIPTAEKTPHLLEFKTHNDSSFKQLCKDGMQKAKPQHYAQMQCYMGLANLTRGLYLAVNKDNDELYAERVHFDKDAFLALLDRAKKIMHADEPRRCSSRPDDYRCKMCSAHSVCWNDSKMVYVPRTPIDCRTCCHSTPETDDDNADGVWSCRKGRKCGPGCVCGNHIALPALIAGTIQEGTEESIEYKSEAGTVFTNGSGAYTTRELSLLTVANLDAGVVDKARELFDGKLTNYGKAVNDEFPPSAEKVTCPL